MRNKISHVIRFQWRKFLLNFSHKINLDWYDKVRYYQEIGKKINLKNPQDLSEKLLWLNKYWQIDFKAKCADKLLIHEYLKDKALSNHAVKIIGSWSSPEEIDFDLLPQKFVLKCNHGCGCNIICEDKTKLNIPEAKQKLTNWLKIDYSKIHNEKHYSRIKPMILCEEFLSDLGNDSMVDYKIHCFNGEPNCVLICKERNAGNVKLGTYSTAWNRLAYLKNEDKTSIDKPEQLNKILEIAKIISSDFPYVRVDFYIIKNKIYIGELTFTPAANIMVYYKNEVLENLGKQLLLPIKT